MEIITDLIQNQLVLVIPVSLAILGCILLFTYSIRPAQQPKFGSALDDRKTAGRKKKLKEKKSPANGHISTGASKLEKSPAKEQKKFSERKKENKDENNIRDIKKIETVKKSAEVVDSKKKATKKTPAQKPLDFDDGNWEMVPSKADKKKKTEPSPTKKEKKVKKQSANVEVHSEEAQSIEIQSSEEDENQEIVEVEPEPEPVVDEPKVEDEPIPVVEEMKEKKREKKPKREIKVEAKPTPAEAVVDPPPINKETVSETVKDQKPTENPRSTAPTSPGPAFDELGDTWKEAKVVKKSKKKTRRDN